jgi:proteic killer suppression protein
MKNRPLTVRSGLELRLRDTGQPATTPARSAGRFSVSRLRERSSSTSKPLRRYVSRVMSRVMGIQSFRCADTRELFETGVNRRFRSIASVAKRKLDYLDAAAALLDLSRPPGNRLEALKGDRAGQHSVRVNDQWRICFVWTSAGPEDVEIVDYH